MATTTLAPFQPGLATCNASSSDLTTTGNANANGGGSLATFTPGMDVNQQAGGNGMNGGNFATGPFAGVQQMLQQPSVKKAMPIILMALAVLLFAILYFWINMPSYRPLMVKMSEVDQ